MSSEYYVECSFCGSPVDYDTGYCCICKTYKGAMTQDEVGAQERDCIDRYKADRELREEK